ncbi:precorrin-6y C5,15-methyltransferase (decarboxylating) subunit CbiE [Desulfovermiculus halophilus]|uniref:precorrin-6y C5,15-methyltransferase (decarboxylating) subunit CbiE n=1 Tax=Desulfovermiculus halophilus TaxID=339722 RepID=UPI000688F41F|nr:precorrin-6y C5,15-methyltransferase (decarboxylating) subunit CbiE [Desulfovermiculus halophilus]
MPIHVIGLGTDLQDQPDSVRELLSSCTVLVGGQRMLEACGNYPARQIQIKAPLESVLAEIQTAKAQREQIAVLADGDPLFYGIGRRLLQDLPAQDLHFHPGITALQTAAARLKIPWDQVRTVSLHGRLELHPLLRLMSRHELIGVYTDATWSPDALARELLKRDIDHFILHVCEDLGLGTEKLLTLDCAQAADMRFSTLNFVLLERTQRPERKLTLGTPEEHLEHENSLITKAEIRSTALGCLHIQPGHTVWDIGAGCGSIGLEASLLAWNGRVICVESDPKRAEHIRTNRVRTGAYALDIVTGNAPECFSELPDPDRIVVGGGISRSPDLVPQALDRLRPGGKIMILCTLLSTLHQARDQLGKAGLEADVQQISISRSRSIGTDKRLEPLNPVFLVSFAFSKSDPFFGPKRPKEEDMH